MTARASVAEINRDRQDGRIEVIKDGYVIWCGRDMAAAETVLRGATRDSEDRVVARRYQANLTLPRAIDRLRG